MTNPKPKGRTAIGLLLAVLALGVIACNGDQRLGNIFGDAMVDMGRAVSDTANDGVQAQVPSSCSQWEVRVVIPPTVRRTPFTVVESPDTEFSEWDYGTIALEAGWEPFSASETAIHTRRCLTP